MESKQRLEQAWQHTREWITQFDGAPTETYLANVDAEAFLAELPPLAGAALDFRAAVIGGKGGEQSEPLSQQDMAESLAKLQAGKLSGLNINLTAHLGGADLDLHIVVHTLGNRKIDLEIIWWADQAFPEGTSQAERIRELLAYFMELQARFGAQRLYVGPEAYEKPGPGSLSWLEI